MTSGKKPISGYLAFFLLATVLIFATLYATHLARNYIQHKAETLFREKVNETKGLVNERLESIESLLYGAQGVFAASRRVDRDEWAAFIGKLDVKKRFPGVVATRYVERVPAGNKASFEEKVRADTSLLPAGYPQFQIHPPGERDPHYVVKYVEPYEGNELMLGLDLGFEPIRQEALERARDTGFPSLTKRVTLVIDHELPVPGFLMLAPIYRNGAPLSTVQERQAALIGFVDAAIRAPDMFADLFKKKRVHPQLDFEVFDGETRTKEHLIYDEDHRLHAGEPEYQPRFAATEAIQMGGQRWSLYFTSLPGFGLGRFQESFPLRVLFSGLLFSFLLFALFYSQATVRDRVYKRVKKLTADLRQNEALLESFLDNSPAHIFLTDLKGQFLLVNRHAEEHLGRKKKDILGKSVYDFFPKETAEKIQADNKKVLAAKAPMEFEQTFQEKGRERHFICMKFPLLDASGNPFAIGGISSDITERKKAEKKLQAFQSRFANILNISDDAIISTDRNRNILLFNRGAEHIFGYLAAEVMGKPVESLMPEKFRPIHPKHVEAFSKSPESARMMAARCRPIFALRKNGTEFPAEISISKLILEGETIFTAFLRDVTERKLAEDQINLKAHQQAAVAWLGQKALETAELEPLFQAAVEAVSKTLGVKFAKILELQHDGKTLLLRAGVGWKEGSVGRATVPAGKESQAGYTLLTKQPVIAEDLSKETRFRPPPLLLEHGINCGISVTIEGKEKPFGVLGAHCDKRTCRFTEDDAHFLQAVANLLAAAVERHESEKTIQSKTDQLQIVSNSMAAFLSSGDYRAASAGLLKGALKLTGSEYGFAGVVVEGPVLRILAHEGIVWDKMVNQEFYQNAMRTYKEKGYLEFTNLKNLFGSVIVTGKQVLSNEPSKDPRSGGRLPAGHPPLRHFLGVPILSGKEVVGMIGVANHPQGYTELEVKELELLANAAGVVYDNYRRQEKERLLAEQLRQSQKMDAIGRLAGGVAHDFNNLLTVIGGYSEILSQKIQPDDLLMKDVDEIKKAADRASRLTQQLLAFGRKQIIQSRVFELNEVVSEMEKMLQRLIGEDVELLTLLESGHCRINADVNQIEQVLMNLVVNARDAMPHGGRITIETQRVDIDEAYIRRHVDVTPGTYVLLVVSDTGVGMEENVRSRIFEPFFTTKEKGAGLGLATVYGIVKQSSGNILVYSEPGKGTTFKVYFPCVKETVQMEGKPQLAPEKLVGTETILLVEDEEMIRELAKTVLEMKGYRVLAAANGGEALRLVEQTKERIHLMLTDVVMPKMSGKQLADRMVQIHPETKVLYMSGYTENAIVRQGVLDPGIRFIGKPFTPNALVRKIREVLDLGK